MKRVTPTAEEWAVAKENLAQIDQMLAMMDKVIGNSGISVNADFHHAWIIVRQGAQKRQRELENFILGWGQS